MKIEFVTFFILLFIIGIETSGQTDSTYISNGRNSLVYVGIKSQYGNIIAHSRNVESISNSNPWSLSFEASKLNVSDKSWKNCNCYSKVGLTLAYTNFANPDVLGNAYSLVFFLEPLLTYRNRFYLSMRLGTGISYLNQVYDKIDNPTNLFYSSAISFPLLANLSTNFKITPRWHTNVSVFYNHISNGGISQPNKGVNYPTVSLGLDYILNPIDLPVRNKIKNTIKFPWRVYAGIFGTTRSVSSDNNDRRKLALGLNGGVIKRLGKMYAANIGVELIYDGSHKKKKELTGVNYKTYITSLAAGNNLFFGKYSFSQQFGLYFETPSPGSSWVFQRYSLDYQLNKTIKMGVSLKAHGHVAQNIDLRAGLVF